MKINRKQLLDILKKANSFKHKTLPILDGVYLKATHEGLNLVASNLDVELETTIKGVHTHNFEVVVDDRKSLQKILMKLKCDDIELKQDDDSLLIIHNRGEIKLPATYDIEYLPKRILSGYEKIGSFDFNFLDNFKKASAFAINDELRPTMMGVSFKTNNGFIEIAGTNAYSLFKSIESITDLEFSFIVPAQYSKLVQSGTVNIYNKGNDTNVEFVCNEYTLSFKCIDGIYPNYNAVIPTYNPIEIGVNKKELTESLDIALLTANKVCHKVVLNTYASHIDSTDPDLGTGSKTNISIKRLTSEGIKIAFDAKLFLNALKFVDADDIVIRMSTPYKPIVINDERKTYLIIPSKL